MPHPLWYILCPCMRYPSPESRETNQYKTGQSPTTYAHYMLPQLSPSRSTPGGILLSPILQRASSPRGTVLCRSTPGAGARQYNAGEAARSLTRVVFPRNLNRLVVRL